MARSCFCYCGKHTSDQLIAPGLVTSLICSAHTAEPLSGFVTSFPQSRSLKRSLATLATLGTLNLHSGVRMHYRSVHYSTTSLRHGSAVPCSAVHYCGELVRYQIGAICQGRRGTEWRVEAPGASRGEAGWQDWSKVKERPSNPVSTTPYLLG